MTSDASDEHLVKQAQTGDREAFLTLYNRYLKKVYNRVKSRIPPQDAEDVTQDIFIAVARSLPNFEQRSRFNTWLYTIVNRQIADYYRRYYRTNENLSVSLEAQEEEGIEIAVSDDENVDEKVLLQQALQELPENYQEIILMRFADGLSFAEIAEARKQTLEATKSLFRRAIQALNAKVDRDVL
jgi:RNA polymerase sigma-70 factor, ECF subfamily